MYELKRFTYYFKIFIFVSLIDLSSIEISEISKENMGIYIKTLIPTIENIKNPNHCFFKLFNDQDNENLSIIKTYVQSLELKPFIEQKNSLIFQKCLNYSNFLEQLLTIEKYLKIWKILNFNEKKLYEECTRIGEMLQKLNLYKQDYENDPIIETLYNKAKEDLQKIKNLDKIHSDYETNSLKKYKVDVQKGLISFIMFNSANKIFEYESALKNLHKNDIREEKTQVYTSTATKTDDSKNKKEKILLISLVGLSAFMMLVYYLYTTQYNAMNPMNEHKDKLIELEIE